VAGYFVGASAYPALRTMRLALGNNPALCVLGSNLTVKTSWIEQPAVICRSWAPRKPQFSPTDS
jgi:hypothetical protein